MRLCGLVFYHPKNPQNLSDLAMLAAHKRVPLFIIRRPGDEVDVFIPPRAHVKVLDDVEQLGGLLKDDILFVVLETYALRYITEIRLEEVKGKCVVLVVGAEDYGIPKEEVGRLPGPSVVVKIPVAVQGMSYNVVVSATIALYEFEKLWRNNAS